MLITIAGRGEKSVDSWTVDDLKSFFQGGLRDVPRASLEEDRAGKVVNAPVQSCSTRDGRWDEQWRTTKFTNGYCASLIAHGIKMLSHIQSMGCVRYLKAWWEMCWTIGLRWGSQYSCFVGSQKWCHGKPLIAGAVCKMIMGCQYYRKMKRRRKLKDKKKITVR